MYLGSWKIDDLLTFSCNTHKVTGVEFDADSVPTYRVYEDETGTPILTGSMAKQDDANTVGYYSEQITLSAANGFEKGKSYHIRIAATVDGTAGVTIRTFQLEAEVDLSADALADVNAQVVDAVNVDTYAEPGQEAPPATASLAKKIGYLFKLARNKITQDATTLKVYDDAGTTVDQKATVSDDGTVYTRGEIGTGP
jgi:hypothetical protein